MTSRFPVFRANLAVNLRETDGVVEVVVADDGRCEDSVSCARRR
jgi:hypothetical protein